MPNLFRLPIPESSTNPIDWRYRNAEKHIFINAEGITNVQVIDMPGDSTIDKCGFRVTYKKSTNQSINNSPGYGNLFASIYWIYKFAFTGLPSLIEELRDSQLYRLKQVIKEANRKPLSMPIFDLDNQGFQPWVNSPSLLTVSLIRSGTRVAEGGGGTTPPQ
tara:strand:+ start:487 stop:972 length:486 start_codon:yes stop_codon:yes gene_type:complete